MQKRRSRAEMTAGTMNSLMSAARRSFRLHGYAATSMDALCADAGLTRGALYHHFGGKEGLLEAVVREIDSEMGTRMSSVADAIADPFESLKACCLTYFELALDPEVQQIVLKDAPAVLGQHLRDIDAEGSIAPLVEVLSELMDLQRIHRTDPEALARMLNGAMIDAALWIAASDRPGKAQKSASEALVLLLDGLCCTPSG